MSWPLSSQFILSSNSILAFLLVVLSEVRSHRHPVFTDLLLAHCSHVRCFLIWNGKYPEHSHLKRPRCLWQRVLLLSSCSCLCFDCFHSVIIKYRMKLCSWRVERGMTTIQLLLRKLVKRYQRNIKYMNHINCLPPSPLQEKKNTKNSNRKGTDEVEMGSRV